MEKLILIVIVIGIVWFIISSNRSSELFSSDKNRLCNIYGCSNPRIKRENEMYNVGSNDDGDIIYWMNEQYFLLNDNTGYFTPYTKINKINWQSIPLKVPTIKMDNYIKLGIPMKLSHNSSEYTFKGILSNGYYHQAYLLYGKPYPSMSCEQKYFNYLLVKKFDNEFKIINEIPARAEITPEESVYLAWGSVQLGPLNLS